MSESVAQRLAEIDSLPRATLVRRWQALFGHPPPRHVQVPFLRLALAWRLQMDEVAGELDDRALSRSLRRAKHPAPLSVGTRLVREWAGKTHTVTVLPSGFEYAGKHYRSLSAVAHAITGTVWSGRVFFGLAR